MIAVCDWHNAVLTCGTLMMCFFSAHNLRKDQRVVRNTCKRWHQDWQQTLISTDEGTSSKAGPYTQVCAHTHTLPVAAQHMDHIISINTVLFTGMSVIGVRAQQHAQHKRGMWKVTPECQRQNNSGAQTEKTSTSDCVTCRCLYMYTLLSEYHLCGYKWH